MVLLGLWESFRDPSFSQSPPLHSREATQSSESHLHNLSLGASLTLKASMSSPRKWVNEGHHTGLQQGQHEALGVRSMPLPSPPSLQGPTPSWEGGCTCEGPKLFKIKKKQSQLRAHTPFSFIPFGFMLALRTTPILKY